MNAAHPKYPRNRPWGAAARPCPREIEGYFDFVVPPLEGFWWQDHTDGEIDYARKDDFSFISCIRLPDFVTREDFDWAVSEAAAKKKLDFSAVELLRVDEGLCVQCMHTGPYDASRRP